MEVKYIAYKLLFKSGLHIGEREEFYESSEKVIHSDAIFSAFVNGYNLLYGKDKTDELIRETLKNPPFIISSTFPFYNKEGENYYFFPLPKDQIPVLQEEKIDIKRLKKKEFVEKSIFEELIDGESINSLKILERLKINEEFYKEIIIPRVSLSRFSNHPLSEGDYFHFGEIRFKKGAGLYFLVEFNQPEFENIFDTVMNLLQHEGIGGDRTIGKGLFKFEKEEISLKVPEDGEWHVTLSLYYPKEDEVEDLREGFYELIERRGYIFSPYSKTIKRDIVRMFVPGSVFPSKKEGKIEKVGEILNQHSVYRYGLCFSLPYKRRK